MQGPYDGVKGSILRKNFFSWYVLMCDVDAGVCAPMPRPPRRSFQGCAKGRRTVPHPFTPADVWDRKSLFLPFHPISNCKYWSGQTVPRKHKPDIYAWRGPYEGLALKFRVNCALFSFNPRLKKLFKENILRYMNKYLPTTKNRKCFERIPFFPIFC